MKKPIGYWRFPCEGEPTKEQREMVRGLSSNELHLLAWAVLEEIHGRNPQAVTPLADSPERRQ